MNVDNIRSYIQKEILNDETVEIDAEEDLLLSGTLDSIGVTRLIEYLEGDQGMRRASPSLIV